ncbi:hypothetical protein Q4Q35_04785 [Flavivirga aquimarina]|uniref:Uncharacterized protein n=1 Tax=Flavivirga aquimarina TaxID=2027862 RepID=A0ABT8W7T1_9FLAO|nr:hypothetical protein [Flavivirga aquimarina]MDO5969117.1 hypothetical protein [Flavivirga aquimarina]
MKTKLHLKSAILLIIIALLFQSCLDKPKTKKIDRPKQAIDYEYANALEEEFKKTRGDTINKYLNIRDTREFWFDLDELKKYIAYVEQEADSLGYKNLGIRIYKGAYPRDKSHPDPGYSTVILVPTGDKITSKGSFLPVNITFSGNNNINKIPAYNFAHAGKPPKEL